MSMLRFSDVVGQDQAKLALLLSAVQPRLGGVLLRGEKGSAKTTLARGLAALLPGDAPFIELPLGATEERVIGSVDAARLLGTGETIIQTGLLGAADRGVLYVDEINLLADHLVDSLLDAAATGIGRIERDGISHEFPARFVLIASMNPEEGELRPQLLDRFGLAVLVTAPSDVGRRVAAVRRQLAAEQDGFSVPDSSAEMVLAERIESFTVADVPEELIEMASHVALSVGAEGLRADLMMVRAAAALAGWEGRDLATEEDLRIVAPLVLGHRRRRQPFDEPGIDDSQLESAFDEAADPSPADRPDPSGDGNGGDTVVAPGTETRAPTPLKAPSGGTNSGRSSIGSEDRGRFLRSEPIGEEPVGSLAVTATARAVAARRHIRNQPDSSVHTEDLRRAVRESSHSNLVILAVDASSSMGAEERIAAAKGAVLGLLTQAYQQRDRVALVAFRGDAAELVLRPTGSVEVARARLADLAVGGTTPLASALEMIRDLAGVARRDSSVRPLVVIVTDGRATAGLDPQAETILASGRLAALGLPTMVIDTESGIPRLGMAEHLASLLGAQHVRSDDLGADPAEGLRLSIELLTSSIR